MDYPSVTNLQESSDIYLSDTCYYNYLQKIYNYDNLINPIVINLTDYKYYIPNNLENEIKKWSGNLIIFTFRIIHFNNSGLTKTGHTNVCIYNKDLNMIEFFEPHGNQFMGYNPLNVNINGIIHYIINKIFNVKKSIFKNVQQNIGLQCIQNSLFPKTGHCTAWCLLFIELRLLNKNIDIINVINMYLHWSPKKLDSYIRKYLTHVNKNKKVEKLIKINDYNSFNI